MASPKIFYQRTKSWLPWLGILSLVFLIAGIFWGLIFAPPDYQQGDAFRILYIHVPSAFLSMALYGGMGFLAVLLLVWRIKMAGLMLGMAAQLGASMAFLALVTGSIWGKPMWGAWWVWDARLTSELILLFLYLAILAIKGSFQHKEQGDKVAAIFTLVGLVDLPIIHYSVYWWNTLHQGATLSVFAKPKIAAPMLYPLLLTLAGFSFYCLWVMLHKARCEVLLRDYKQQWVRDLIEKEGI
ncbi:heme ABC transporter permease CcmC [Tatlockia sp. PL877]|nr:heme ABC transporter permease CcmC [Legionella sp. PL877]MDI9818584.1 heme ABC transporter permease CcmC [Legionella sp. PL877]